MNVKIQQQQNRSLLEEHAKSSYNFGFLGRNELYIAIAFLLVGIMISLLLNDNRFVGLPPIIIGLFELIKFPTREKRWVKKKEKEKKYNENIDFEILDDRLKITYDKKSRTYLFNQMRKCLISKTGILFKISLSEYYYISFQSLESDIKEQNLINHLIRKFPKGKIKQKIQSAV